MRQLQRLKRQRRPFTHEVFYIYEVNNLFPLRDRNSHMVISTAGSLAEIKRCMVVILNRYKNYDQYLKAISSMSEKAVTDKQAEAREKEYKKKGHIYIEDIKELIREYYIEKQEVEDRRRGLTVPAPVKQQPKDNVLVVQPHRLNKRRSRRLV